MYRNMAFIHEHSVQIKDGKKVKASINVMRINYVFLLLGVTTGFAGLLIGLIGSGRL